LLISIKMKKKITEKIEIPEGVEVSVEGNKVTAKGNEGENSREFNLGKVNISKKENEIILNYDKATKREKKIINTTLSHLPRKSRVFSCKYKNTCLFHKR